jgi:hypothetical protein
VPGLGAADEGAVVAAVVLAVVVATVVAAAVELVIVLALDEVVEDEECPPIICWTLWQPPKVNMSAAAQARTEKRIGTPIGSKPRHRSMARNAEAHAAISWRVSFFNLTKLLETEALGFAARKTAEIGEFVNLGAVAA